MDVKIKRLDSAAKIPEYAHITDAGLDLSAVSVKYDYGLDAWIYGTGLALEIPEGYVGLVFPRSSNRKTMAYMTNHVGVIDSGYRGEVMLTFKNRDKEDTKAPYELNDKVGQLIILPYPKINFIETDTLSDSDRGTNGHGSTGR